MNIFNNVNLARTSQLPDDDRMIETCRSIFKSFNINNLSVCIGWCADQVNLRSARCDDKEEQIYIYRYYGKESNMLSYNRLLQTWVQITLVIVFTTT